MSNFSPTITCPSCGTQIEVSQALQHELEEKVLAATKQQHQAELKKIEANHEQQTQVIKEQERKKAIEKIRSEYDAKITSTKEEAEETSKENQKLQKEMTEILKDLREEKNKGQQLELAFQKKLLEEQDKIKSAAKKEAQEEMNTSLAQKEKQLQDLQKQLQEAQRKAAQGSQQSQGEVLELELESLLGGEFPFDQIGEVPKGIRGADVIQKVYTRGGTQCGTIVWEIKNTKSWSDGWVTKLKEDQRQLKAEIAVLVSAVLPEGIESFGYYNGVWVCSRSAAVSLTSALRQQLIQVNQAQLAHQGKASKAEVVYDYLISNEFRQRIEVWVEYFTSRREEIEKERRYFTKKWEKEDKSILKVMENTAGVYGDLQGLIGSALPKVRSLELPEGDEV